MMVLGILCWVRLSLLNCCQKRVSTHSHHKVRQASLYSHPLPYSVATMNGFFLLLPTLNSSSWHWVCPILTGFLQDLGSVILSSFASSIFSSLLDHPLHHTNLTLSSLTTSPSSYHPFLPQQTRLQLCVLTLHFLSPILPWSHSNWSNYPLLFHHNGSYQDYQWPMLQNSMIISQYLVHLTYQQHLT